MRVDFGKSWLFTGWLMVWLFIANVPTESPWVGFSELLRVFSWAMLWVPLLGRGIRVSRKAIRFTMVIATYTLLLNVYPFKFEAAFMILNLLNAMLIISAYSESRLTRSFLKAIDLVLYLWAGLLVVQLWTSLTMGDIVDFHSLFFPFSEARYFQAEGDLYRLTGPHIEPGTYSGWTYGLVLLRCLVGGRVLTTSTLIAMATVPLTLSAWGVLAAGAFATAAIMVSLSRRDVLWAAGALAGIWGLLLYFYGGQFTDIQGYMMSRSELSDVSGQSKKMAYEAFQSNFGYYMTWGSNFTYKFCPDCLSPQDAGLGVNVIVYFGLLFALVITAMVLRAAYRKGGGALVVLFLPLFFAKYFIWEALFWLVVFLSLQLKSLTPAGVTASRHSNLLQH